MRAIDTNVLVRLITRDDPIQTQKAEKFVADSAWVSILVLAESIWVLESVYSLNKTQLCTAISMLLQHQQLVMQEADVIHSALNDFSENTGVSFTDCLVVALAKKNGHVPLGTFDKKLAKVANAQEI